MTYLVPTYHESKVEKPVEHVFSCIFNLHALVEYDRFTNALKEELEKLFEDVKERNGKKKIRSIVYYPNGLCEWDKKSEKIVLKSWNNETEVEGHMRNYSMIKNVNVIWYLQFMSFMKKPIRISDEKIKIREMVALQKGLNSLSEDEKKLLSADEESNSNREAMNHDLDKLARFFNLSSHRNHHHMMEYDEHTNELRTNTKVFKLLNQEQLEGLKALYESHLEGWSFISKLNVTLSNYVRELGMNDEAKLIIDFSDLLVDTKNMNELAKDHWGNKVVKKKPYTFDFEQISEAALSILDRLSEVEDEGLKKALKKLGI